MCNGRLYTDNNLARLGNARVLELHLQSKSARGKIRVFLSGGDMIFSDNFIMTVQFPISLPFADNEAYYSQFGPSKRAHPDDTVFFDGITPAVRLIQRNMRLVARARILRRGMRLAAMMAAHARLGAASPLQLLEPDLLQLVCAGV